ncbi:MAG: agmatinase [Mariniblastus sp.]|nr:agmatinase [Mariniblastus sp.]
MFELGKSIEAIGILGIPYDADSSFLAGCRKGPAAIRAAMACPSGNWVTENGLDLEEHPRIRDLGDVELVDSVDPRTAIESALQLALKQNLATLSLGGDHSVTYPILKAYAGHFGPINVLQLDAHPDLYDALDGNRFSHACPFARAHEDGLIQRHVQIGIRTMTPHQQTQADRFGVEVRPMATPQAINKLDFSGPVYLTLDLDVLDPAFAPGVSHYEPGGMSVRDILSIIQNLDGLIGADIVELNPDRDFQEMTARVAAKCMKEILARILGNS